DLRGHRRPYGGHGRRRRPAHPRAREVDPGPAARVDPPLPASLEPGRQRRRSLGDWRGRKILDAILADPNVDLLLCPITGALASMSGRLAQDLVDVAQTTDKPVFVVWGSPVGDEDAYQDILLKSDVPVFRTFANAVRAAKAYFDYHA